MKNSNKKIDKNKLLIIISSLVLLLVTIIGVVVLAKRISDKETSNEVTPPSKEDTEKNMKNLFYNNYLISYILEGDVQVGEATLTIEGEEGQYYAVNDPLLKNIKSSNDIRTLIEDTLFPDGVVRTLKLMESDYANHYMSRDGALYVSKTANPCTIYSDDGIDKSKIEIEIKEDNIYAIYEYVPFQGYYDEDGKLKAGTLWFACSKNFPNIGTDGDSVYDPTYEEETEEEQNNENEEN